jgi:hypothetical protein
MVILLITNKTINKISNRNKHSNNHYLKTSSKCNQVGNLTIY